MTQAPRTIEVQNDDLGILAFRAIADAITKQTDDKRLLFRLNSIAAVFEHRTSIAVGMVDVVARHYYWERRELELRLETFRPPKFFIQAAQSVLDEVLDANAAKELLAAERRAKRKTPHKHFSFAGAR